VERAFVKIPQPFVMKICHTVFHEMPPISSWEEWLERFPGVANLLLAQQDLGLQPSWIAPSVENHTFSSDKIKIRLVSTSRYFRQNGSLRKYVGWNQAGRVVQAIAEENPEVIHQHGFNSWMAMRTLHQLIREHGIRCIVQDHGGGVPSFRIKKRLYKKPLAAIQQAVFGDAHTRDLWINRGMLAPEKCQILFAASSTFKPVGEQKRARLRRQLQMEGLPIFGWVAHLDANKDPLTILRACAIYFEKNPAARFYMHFIKDDLRTACENVVASSPALQQRVFLRGRLPHAQLESFHQAIDYFVQGSHHEAYGYSAVEAMSTGAIPILSDVSSFRLLCEDGRCGFLFPPGNAEALQKILLQLPRAVKSDERLRVITRFENEFSYPAIAKKFIALYQ
jgi:glycosyltransferase involved in cell wall biosynthesis